jgi:hypothetical protein
MPLVAYRAIRSRNLLPDFDQIIEAVEAELDDVIKPALISLLEQRVANWKTQVDFEGRKVINQDSISVYVYPTTGKDIFGFVSKGTKDHDIPSQPKGPRQFLQFPYQGPGQSHIPKTTPGGGYGGPGVKIGPVTRFKQVHHPGIRPRNIEKHVKDEYQPEFRRLVENAFRRGIRAAKRNATA